MRECTGQIAKLNLTDGNLAHPVRARNSTLGIDNKLRYKPSKGYQWGKGVSRLLNLRHLLKEASMDTGIQCVSVTDDFANSIFCVFCGTKITPNYEEPSEEVPVNTCKHLLFIGNPETGFEFMSELFEKEINRYLDQISDEDEREELEYDIFTLIDKVSIKNSFAIIQEMGPPAPGSSVIGFYVPE